ncbi:MAG: class I SAM-dependent methyltransferase [Candidatus Nitrohelix vancouverensis]|uniref:Class I SAM-dependent methyltransferase n=1 Tax=Candidatus Nitrohelix vancouverensis TaxID=2705534 RepID=A0A7T0C186_9BACT|nr:MAG: class I SAM-dependent methyltransferase [Candidatus Nitrohelix vancouverensis]
MTDEKNTCKLCDSSCQLFYQDKRKYFKCDSCGLIFTNDAPGKVEEEAHYRSQWEETQPEFWISQADVLLQIIRNYHEPLQILDFGSGSGELTRELRSRDLSVTPLEPMEQGYLKDQQYPGLFDVVVALEVLEHLPQPLEELLEIDRVLAPGGIFVCSTALTNAFLDHASGRDQFAQWWYKDDPTHLCFFGNRTLEALAQRLDWGLDIYGEKAFVMKKPGE